MNQAQRFLLYDIRLKSKRGRSLNEEEMDFCRKMFALDPTNYTAIGTRVQDEVTQELMNP